MKTKTKNIQDEMLMVLKIARVELMDDDTYYLHKKLFHTVDEMIKKVEGAKK